ncbi:hypothetical protein BDBG_04447 [Blastomyces gilchristii SLH14081]|uniref:Uncharacterized protein n=1 Tax=Blastomyces gilchristii (strain SLH14081) TaxID=559298 RepID=A0A179UP91_BLAGS|nr:uncharacterized protein BDBG_04447 [Blastomyces gilchristii SLH14081]OAT08841.1 hypothetical protein BDBG_04447 [Blastomyces gilchristii SLH14081]
MAAFRPRPSNFRGTRPFQPGGLATLRVSKHRALVVISSHHQYKISGQAPPRKLDSVLPTNDIASTDGTKVISQLLVLSGKRFFEEPFKVFRGLRAIFNDHIAFGLSVYAATHFNNNESQVGFGFEKDAQGRRTIVRAGLKLFHILEAAEIDCREPISHHYKRASDYPSPENDWMIWWPSSSCAGGPDLLSILLNSDSTNLFACTD